MAHQLVLFINLIGVLLFDAFLIGEISITQNIPPTMDPGSEVRVTVTVNKGELKGFAKLQLDLPDGMTATAIETNGASFTFADQKAKFIWMALPATPTFKVSYTLAAATDASGNLPIIGRFSYIEDNERKTYDLPTTTVNLGSRATAPVVQEVPSDQTEEVTEAVKEEANDVANEAIPKITEISPSAPSPSTTTTTPVVTTPPVTSPTVSTPTPPTPNVQTPTVPTPSVTASTPTNTATAVVDNASGTANMQGKGDVSSTRKVTAITAEEMLVEVTIKKGAIRGFGKLQEVIPAGFQAVEKNSEDAIFTTQDRIVKFVWLNLPAKNEVNVVYKLRSNDPSAAGERTIDGEFGYLLNDETQKCTTGTTKFMVGPDAIIAGEPEVAQNIPTPDPVVEPKPIVTPKVDPPTTSTVTPIEKTTEPTPAVETKPVAKPKPAPVKEMRPEVTQEPVVAERSTIPSPEKGITFKIQIIAGHKEVSKSYFRTLHKYSGAYSLERHQGWIKYVTGSFTAYKDARDQRNNFVQAGHNFPGPFVTAYNNGERITVQEALVLSNQKWAS